MKFRRSFLPIRCRKDGDFIEILNSYPVMVCRSQAIGFLCITVAIILLIITLILSTENMIPVAVGIFVFLVAALSALYGCYNLCEVETNITEYQVIIDDDYLAKDLLDRFEIVNQEGKILYLRDKEGDS